MTAGRTIAWLAALLGGSALAQPAPSQDTPSDVPIPVCANQAFYEGATGKCLSCPPGATFDSTRKVCLIYSHGPGTGGSEGVSTTITPNPPAVTSVLELYPFTVNILGGIEGYTGALSSRLDLGPTYGVSVRWDGLAGWLGMELGYSGSGINLQLSPAFTPVGTSIYRNGGYFDLLPGIPLALNGAGTAVLRPYLLGGIGVDRFSVQNYAVTAVGYQSTTVGAVPFGAGVAFRSGPYVADARFNWTWETGNFSPVGTTSPFRYQAQLSVGVAF
jgi:hypothetical protein